jgi:hypothetical protein
MKNLLKISCLLSVVLFNSCVAEISEEIPYELNYIVYGSITNQKQQVQIEVYKSSLLLIKPSLDEEIDNSNPNGGESSFNGKGKSVPINDAIVTLYSQNNGNNVIVADDFNIEKGVYTSSQEIEGKEGNTYWVEVTLNDGTKLISKKETLKKTVAIKKAEFVENNFVKVTFEDPKNERNLYLLESRFLFKDKLVWASLETSNDVLFDGNKQVSMGIDVYGKPQKDPPLDELSIRLSHVNFSTYQFFLNLKQQFEENGNYYDENEEQDSSGHADRLFSAPSVSLYGNIINEGTGKKALGNFSVLAVSTVTF